MDGIATENLLLLEFLVDSVNLDPTCDCDDDGEGEKCVSFQFLDNVPLEVCEADFNPQRNYDSKCPKDTNIKSGKSCLFSLSPDQAENAITKFDIFVTIFKKMPRGWIPSIVEIGNALISIANLFEDLINRVTAATGKEGGTPTAKTLKDEFDVTSTNGDLCGKIGVYIRMSCFGKLIVTQFQMNLQDQSVLFKDKQGKSLYRYKKAGKGSKGGCTPKSIGFRETENYRRCPTYPCNKTNGIRKSESSKTGSVRQEEKVKLMNDIPIVPNPFSSLPSPHPPIANQESCVEACPYRPCGGNLNNGQFPGYPPDPAPFNAVGDPNINAINTGIGFNGSPGMGFNGSSGMGFTVPCVECERLANAPCTSLSAMQNNYGGAYGGYGMNPAGNFAAPNWGYGAGAAINAMGDNYSQIPQLNSPVLCSVCDPCPFNKEQNGDGDKDKGKKECKVVDPDKELFVLRIGKKREGVDAKKNLELELCTPKGKELKPIPRKVSVDTQYDPKDLPVAKGKGKGKGSKGRKKKK